MCAKILLLCSKVVELEMVDRLRVLPWLAFTARGKLLGAFLIACVVAPKQRKVVHRQGALGWEGDLGMYCNVS